MNKFGIDKIFISSFLKILWECPEVIHHILVKTDHEIVQANLAPLIVNNFYCNLLSGNYLENNLLYIFTMMLKDEIDGLQNIDDVDNFLEDTKCGYLLEELRKMPDIQLYFKKVILKTVEKIEGNYSFRLINFNVDEIYKDLLKMKKDEEKKDKKNNSNKSTDELYDTIINSKIIDLSINYSREENSQKCNKRNGIFIKKYTPDVKIADIQEKEENAKKDKKSNLYNYFAKLENDIKKINDNDLYSNKVFMKKLLDTNLPTYLLSFYLNDFLEVISFISQLLDDIVNNVLLLPNSIKYICKIILLLIKKKFQNISQIEAIAFISKFIINKLLIPFISSPNFNTFISDFIISGNTIKNIKVINYIIKKLFSGKLFRNNKDEGDYTPFNWYIMDNIESILYFYEKAINVNLPNFIEDYINNKLPKKFYYDYFNENKEQLYASISICFNVKNLYHLIKGLSENDHIFNTDNPEIIKLKKFLKKLKPEKYLNDINIEKKVNERKFSITKNEKLKEENKEKIIENYFLYNDKVIDKKYNHLFELNNIIGNFYIDIHKKNKKLDENEKNIIKIKNYLSNSLGNYRLLNKSDFSIGTTSDTIKMLNEIKTYMALPYFIIDNNNIPSIWYINSLLDHLNKIPEDYKKNDFKKIFDELTNDIKESIDNLDFEKLILFRKKLKYIDKIYHYYNQIPKLINDIKVNENIKHIVEDVFIPVDISFEYEKHEKKFELVKSNIKDVKFEDKIKYEDPKKKFISFKTIEAFTRYFPNLSKYQTLQDINPLFIIKNLSINKKINNYFEIIKERIIKKSLVETDKYEDLYGEKIKNYIMNKIYKKIYPPEPDDNDVKILKKTYSLSWYEPKQLVNKEYLFDGMLPDIINEFNQLYLLKTPYQKSKCIERIIISVVNLIKFNEGIDKEIGAEDIIRVLHYVFIQSHPYRIFTDIEFIKLFSYEEGLHDNNLANIESICNLVLNNSAKDFDLSQEEYDKKCQDAAKYYKNHEELMNN